MSEFYIEWRINLDANSPRHAARQALAIQRDPFSDSTVFHVRPEDAKDFTVVDLEVFEDEADDTLSGPSRQFAASANCPITNHAPTSGPWWWTGNGEVVAKRGDGEVVIADPFCSGQLHEAECRANARIIAAAPQMLAALKDLISSINCHDSTWLHQEAAKYAALIAEAEGGAA